MDLKSKFLKSFIKINECWIWNVGSKVQGYGRFYIGNSKRVPAHIYSYKLYKGEISEGLEIDHLCRNRDCVNPDHLEAVTHEVNVLRGESLQAKNFRREYCFNGHILTHYKNNKSSKIRRRCEICIKEYAAEYRKNNREKLRKYAEKYRKTKKN